MMKQKFYKELNHDSGKELNARGSFKSPNTFNNNQKIS